MLLLSDEPVRTLDEYKAVGGGDAFAQAQRVGPDELIALITRSGLRGRGGGGFPTGRKWQGVRAGRPGTRYVVCNAAEGEPGTFKDRALMRNNPYQVVEGLAIAALAVGADAAYIATKASYTAEAAAIERAVEELSGDGLIGALAITLVLGPEEYLFGEEKALLEVIEGRDPLPRILPPYEHGLFATDVALGWDSGDVQDEGQPNPTLVNNVETLANVPHIVRNGSDWFRSMGTPESPGTIVATVVGDVQRPLLTEVAMGTSLRALIDAAGGPHEGRELRACFSGVANAVIVPPQFDVAVSYEGLAAIGSGLGSAGFVLYDTSACMVDVARAFSRFLYVESCGQCRSCKFGSGEITRALEALSALDGSQRDIALIGARLQSVTDQARCYLATEEQVVVSSILRECAEEFALHIEGRCSAPGRHIVVPKIVDLHDGEVTYDDKQDSKQPDWTYV